MVIILLSEQPSQTSIGSLRLNFIFTQFESGRSEGLRCCQGVLGFSSIWIFINRKIVLKVSWSLSNENHLTSSRWI